MAARTWATAAMAVVPFQSLLEVSSGLPTARPVSKRALYERYTEGKRILVDG